MYSNGGNEKRRWMRLADSTRATYFFSLAYMLGNNAVDDLRRKTGYHASQEEYEMWAEDARRMRVRM